MFNELFAERLSQELKTARFSQSTLARKIGVDRSTIGNYLACKTTPKAMTLYRMAEVFDVDTDYLCGYTNERSHFMGYTNIPSKDTKFISVIANQATVELMECFGILSSQDQEFVLSIAKRLAETYDSP